MFISPKQPATQQLCDAAEGEPNAQCIDCQTERERDWAGTHDKVNRYTQKKYRPYCTIDIV